MWQKWWDRLFTPENDCLSNTIKTTLETKQRHDYKPHIAEYTWVENVGTALDWTIELEIGFDCCVCRPSTTGRVTMSRPAVWMIWSCCRRSLRQALSRTWKRGSWRTASMYPWAALLICCLGKFSVVQWCIVLIQPLLKKEEEKKKKKGIIQFCMHGL